MAVSEESHCPHFWERARGRVVWDGRSTIHIAGRFLNGLTLRISGVGAIVLGVYTEGGFGRIEKEQLGGGRFGT